MAQQIVTETRTGLIESTVGGKTKKVAGIISPGEGSSGIYPQEVLEAAAADKIFPAGTHMYFDHPTAQENADRPERSVLTLGAVTNEDARWDDSLGKLVAGYDPVQAFEHLLNDDIFTKAVGLSIRALAEVKQSESGGKPLVTRLVEGQSIDFVTHAGRGGSILTVAESARPSVVNAKAIEHGISEATVNDRREALANVVRDAYATDDVWVWLRDFDDAEAIFDIESGDDAGTWKQPYTADDAGMPVALSGDRTEVRASTTYVPVDPVGQLNTQESAGGHMATTPIEESALAELREKAGRVTVLETERDTAVKERDELKESFADFKAEIKRGADATAVIEGVAKEAEVSFTPLEIAGLKAALPLKEGALDTEAFTTTVAAEAAKIATSGRVTSFGATQDEQIGESDFASAVAGAFGRTVQEA
jgi:hypothetical protein